MVNGRTNSVTRRTRFIDDEQLENLSDENTSSIFGRASIAPVLAVLHDAVPDLENRCKAGVRISESSSTLANLTAEFNDLSRKMTLLKKTIESNCNGISATRKPGPIQIDSSSQALQICNLPDVAAAKLVIRDCIAELTSINHTLEGNEEIAASLREKLRHAIENEYGKSEAVVMRHVFLAPPISEDQSPIPSGEKSTVDTAVGTSDHHLNRNKKEAEIQTEPAEQTASSEASTDKSATKSPAANALSKPTDEPSQELNKRAAQKKSRKW